MKIQLSDHFTYKMLLRFVLPSIIMMVFTSIYGVVDGLFVSNFVGKTPFAAVNLVMPFIMIFGGIGFMFGTGGSALVAKTMGEGDKHRANQYFTMMIAVTLICGVIISTVGVIYMEPISIFLGADEEMLADCVLYGRIVLAFNTAFMLQNVFQSFLIAAEKPKLGLWITVAAGVTNMVLDALFMAVFHWGVAGAAIATDISQLVSCVLALRFLMRVQDDYRVTAREIRVHGKMAVRIIKVGLPTGIQNMVISLSNILVQASVNGYGAAAMAGFAAYMKVDGFNILPIMSFSMAATTFVGQNFGAGKLDRVKKSLWVTLGMGIVYTILTGVLLLAFQDPIMHLFTHEEDVVAFGCTAMHYFCPFYWELSILHGLAGTVRGTGKTIPPMVVLLVSLCVFRIGWIQWVLPFFSSIDGIFLLYPVSWGLGALMMVGYAWKVNWLKT